MQRARVLASNVTLSGAAETVVCTLSGLTTRAGDAVDIEGTLQVLGGTSGTDIRCRVRRGVDTTGALVGNIWRMDATGAINVNFSLNVTDFPPESQGLSYVLTVLNTGAAANGTAVLANLAAIWGN